MKLWIGGEISADVADAFREARSVVEHTINSVISPTDYGLELESWDCIAIIRDDDEFTERTRFDRKSRDMDFRLVLDYARFKAAAAREQQSMIVEMLLRSLNVLAEKGLSPTGMARLRKDTESAAKKMGWLQAA